MAVAHLGYTLRRIMDAHGVSGSAAAKGIGATTKTVTDKVKLRYPCFRGDRLCKILENMGLSFDEFILMAACEWDNTPEAKLRVRLTRDLQNLDFDALTALAAEIANQRARGSPESEGRPGRVAEEEEAA